MSGRPQEQQPERERRKDDVRLIQVEIEVKELKEDFKYLKATLELVKDHLRSELGGDNTVGNVHYRLSELKVMMQDHIVKFDKAMSDNGRPGIPTRLTRLEEGTKDLPDLRKAIVDMKLSMAKWIGGGAVIMAIAMPLVSHVVTSIWK